MNLSRRVKEHSTTAEAEQRPSSSYLTRSKSHLEKPSKSTGGRSDPQDSPPIDPHTSQTPLKRLAHMYSTGRALDSSSEKDKEQLENETEDEDGQEDALQALASYMAFQRTLLRNIEIDTSFAAFSDQHQTSASVESTSLHTGHGVEGFMRDLDIGKGKQPEHRF